MIIYLSPKCLKRVEKVKETNFFKKTRIETILDKRPCNSTAIFIFFLLFLGYLLKQCSVFEILLQFTLPPTLYKAETRKKIPGTRVQHVIVCRRTLHLCNRYPFRLLVKSVSAVSGRDIMVVKLLLYFFSVCVLFSFFVVLICVLFWFFFGCLFVCCCFCFLFLWKNSLLLIV